VLKGEIVRSFAQAQLTPNGAAVAGGVQIEPQQLKPRPARAGWPSPGFSSVAERHAKRSPLPPARRRFFSVFLGEAGLTRR